MFNQFETKIWWGDEAHQKLLVSMHANSVAQLITDVESFQNATFTDPVQAIRLGQPGFNEILPHLLQLSQNLEKLHKCRTFDFLSATEIFEFATSLRGFTSAYHKAADYLPKKDPEETERKALVTDLTGKLMELCRTSGEFVGRIPNATVDIAWFEKAKVDVEEGWTEAKHILEHMRRASSETSVEVYEAHFEREAQSHFSTSWAFMVAGIVALIVFIFLAREPMNIASNSDNAVVMIQLVHQLAVPSIFLAIVLFCSKVFNLERHNGIINRHRALALRTFQAFTDGAKGDLPTQRAVLTSANSTVFAPRPTGYLKAGIGLRELKTPAGSITSESGDSDR